VGGFWVYRKYIRQKEKYSHIEVGADINVIGLKDQYWIVELISYVENKGKVQHILKNIDFELCSLNKDDKVMIFSGLIKFFSNNSL
jgi:uncharacterized pyridoxamine 5'-phosphate oxidase family protein